MASLHRTTPGFARHDDGILQHRSKQFIQHGHGIGGLFRSIAKFIVPAAKSLFKNVKNVGQKVLANPVVRNVMKTVKDEAIKTAINAVSNVVAGEPVAPKASEDIRAARKEIAKVMRQNQIQPIEEQEEQQSGRGRKRRKVYDDIFTID